MESVVLTHQVRAIDRRRIKKVVGRLSDADVGTLEGQLSELLGL